MLSCSFIHSLPPTSEVWGKVMFLYLCVILFMGVYTPWIQTTPGADTAPPPGKQPPPSLPTRQLKRVVRILLEWILVHSFIYYSGTWCAAGSTWAPWSPRCRCSECCWAPVWRDNSPTRSGGAACSLPCTRYCRSPASPRHSRTRGSSTRCLGSSSEPSLEVRRLYNKQHFLVMVCFLST